MTDPKEKPKIKGRTPKKVTPGTFDNLRKPHPVEEFLGLVAIEPTRPTPPTPRTSPTLPTAPIAPERDFTKTANSIVLAPMRSAPQSVRAARVRPIRTSR